MRLSINLATRGRPELLLWTLDQTLSNIVCPDTTLMVSVDHDDGETIDRLSQYFLDHPQIRISVKPREDSLGEKYNRVLEECPADVYLTMVDYCPHITRGFDEMILEAASLFPDGIGVVYNRMVSAAYPCINAVTHGLAEKMGFIYPPYFPYWFVDHWLDDIARLTDRIAFADVLIDRTRRPGTQEKREQRFWATVFELLWPLRLECAREIIVSDEFDEPQWRKQLLLERHPLVEYRSQWFNNLVKQGGAEQPDAGPPDERYLRLKAQALEMVKPAIESMQNMMKQLEAA